MKKFNLIIAAFCALVACTPKSETEPLVHDQDSYANLEISVPEMASTKADVGRDATVNSCQIFIFREDGRLETGTYTESLTSVLKVTHGIKDVAVVLNYPKITDALTFTALKNMVVTLNNCTASSVVMFGTKNLEINSDCYLPMEVSRLVAKVEIKNIKNAITLDQYKDLPVKLRSISLLNAVGSRTLAGSLASPEWYNKMSYTESLAGLLGDSFSDKPLPNQTSVSVNKVYYCFPNMSNDTISATWSPRCTRFVVEVQIGDVLSYYPVTIPRIEANKHYVISSFVITRLGSVSPDKELMFNSLNISLSVKDWVNVEIPDVTI